MQGFCLEVTGDYACFTRPEMKVERVSYDVITPSAARAVFEAILWKPAMTWRIEKVEVLNPTRWISLRRNEVGAVTSARNAESTMRAGRGQLGMYIEDERQQRAGLFLRDVRYRLHARFELTARAGAGDTAAKFSEMFRRRARAGQCVNQPYLGCREFSAKFRLIEELSDEPTANPELNDDLGWMLYDLDYRQPNEPSPRFFRARLDHGVMQVPAWNSPEVRG
ncbi:MAG: type I-C CRISPR-associated protein Cas5 [Gammaproteobacteria bacterium HGW-Gammaproteobacteria-6]|jgi:CRISPR-associated protein Cas5d|nr:MAG: type I-C CRISPR-associated protein Cas5 [Gammaproteobacteria bacterium HGW-Gammaproteobacteria-6]